MNLQDTNDVENEVADPSIVNRPGPQQASGSISPGVEISSTNPSGAIIGGRAAAAIAAASNATTGPPSAGALTSTSNQGNNGLIQPHARFSMALNRGKVTVKFDPPM